jgi:hypothetical protein
LKKLVIIEGLHDGIFLKKIMDNSIGNSEYLYYKNRGKKEQKRYSETDILRKFISEKNKLDFLIKEEGGKSFVKNFFLGNIINFSLNYSSLELTVIFDHDGKHPTQEITQWKKDFESKNNNVTFDNVSNPVKITKGLYWRKFDLYQIRGKNTVKLNYFHLVTFDKSLESEVAEFCNKSKKQITEQDIQDFASQVPLKNLFP